MVHPRTWWKCRASAKVITVLVVGMIVYDGNMRLEIGFLRIHAARSWTDLHALSILMALDGCECMDCMEKPCKVCNFSITKEMLDANSNSWQPVLQRVWKL
jgi:hypothetical protein